jgi:hypothetical protein
MISFATMGSYMQCMQNAKIASGKYDHSMEQRVLFREAESGSLPHTSSMQDAEVQGQVYLSPTIPFTLMSKYILSHKVSFSNTCNVCSSSTQ